MDKVEIIKPGTLTKLEFSTDFIRRIQELASYISNSVSVEELNVQIEAIKANTQLSEFGTHFETVVILLNDLEAQARTQGLTDLVPLPDTPAE